MEIHKMSKWTTLITGSALSALLWISSLAVADAAKELKSGD